MEIQDPIKFFDQWRDTAQKNSDIYDEVFIKTHSTIEKEKDLHFLTEYNSILKPVNVLSLQDIEGFLVTFPRGFLLKSGKSVISSEGVDNKLYM
jgi:hypothetical protein